MYLLEREMSVPVPRAALFPFFADARNLERLTPLGALAHRLFGARRLDDIFSFRARIVRELFTS